MLVRKQGTWHQQPMVLSQSRHIAGGTEAHPRRAEQPRLSHPFIISLRDAFLRPSSTGGLCFAAVISLLSFSFRKAAVMSTPLFAHRVMHMQTPLRLQAGCSMWAAKW